MKIPLTLAVLLFSVLARADVVIVQSVDGMAQSAQMTITVGHDKIRTDVNSDVSMIADITTGEVTTLMTTKKSYMVISAAASKAMADQIRKVMQQFGGAATPAAPAATGKTDKINGYNAAEYTYSNGNMKATYWICSDFPNAKMVTDALAAFRKSSLSSMTRGIGPDLSTLPGVPVKTETEINGQKITTALVSANDQAVDPSRYQVPAGYTEVKMPVMPQQ